MRTVVVIIGILTSSWPGWAQEVPPEPLPLENLSSGPGAVAAPTSPSEPNADASLAPSGSDQRVPSDTTAPQVRDEAGVNSVRAAIDRLHTQRRSFLQQFEALEAAPPSEAPANISVSRVLKDLTDQVRKARENDAQTVQQLEEMLRQLENLFRRQQRMQASAERGVQDVSPPQVSPANPDSADSARRAPDEFGSSDSRSQSAGEPSQHTGGPIVRPDGTGRPEDDWTGPSPVPIRDDVVDQLALANNLFGIGEHSLALEIYLRLEQANRGDDDRLWIVYQIASCHRRLGHMSEAEKFYRVLAAETGDAPLVKQARWWLDMLDKLNRSQQRLAAIQASLATLEKEFNDSIATTSPDGTGSRLPAAGGPVRPGP